MSITAPETERADCLYSRQLECLSSPRRIRSSVHCPVAMSSSELKSYGHYSAIGIRLALVTSSCLVASSSSVLSRTYGHHSVVGICLMSLFTYLAILSRFLVRVAVGKHCGWSSETAMPSRFLRVGFV